MVFMNRVKLKWYAGDLYDNVTRWLSENPGEFPDTRDPEFEKLLASIDAVLAGMYTDKTAGALWFAPTSSLEPEGITGTVTTTIGSLAFIR
jgi:hypothetical protein